MQDTYISFRVVKKTKGNYFEYILLNSVYPQYCHRNMQFQHEVFYTFFFSAWRGPFTWRTVNHPRTVDYVAEVRIHIYTHRSEVIQLICHPHTPCHKPPPACRSLCPSWPVWACVLQDGTLAEVEQTQWVQAPTSGSWRAS